MESHLLRTYDKFLAELIEFSYSELNRLLKVKNVTSGSIKDYLNPSLALVLLLYSVKVDLLSISGSWLSAWNKGKRVFKETLNVLKRQLKKECISSPRNHAIQNF